jgi:nitrogenase-associated protein
MIVFYQKPGCQTNGRQKRMLEIAGHTVIAKNLLAEPWTADGLRRFFGATPVATWFNPAAPRVKSGDVIPATLDAAAALALMLDDPLLIRRPLVEMEGQRCAGFDREPVMSLLGNPVDQEAEGCSRPVGPFCTTHRFVIQRHRISAEEDLPVAGTSLTLQGLARLQIPAKRSRSTPR